MALQYFHFQEPQKILCEWDGGFRERMALGYWQDTDSPSSTTRFNLAAGELNATGWEALIEVRS